MKHDIESIFGPGGVIDGGLQDYEYRPEQGRMAQAVAEVFASGRKLVVEAGTGTGKTLAYLIPSILSGEQVVVSTGTKNLQEQIFFRDIPRLKNILDVDFSTVMLKGRSNYLCPERLKRFAQLPVFRSGSEEKWWERVHLWAKTTKTGDRAELEDLPETNSLWPHICSNSDVCSAQKCGKASDCFINRLRRRAEESQVIVVNHHLFFADLAIREKGVNGVLPYYHAVVFDEAHLIEETASQYFGFSVSSYRIDELLRDVVREIELFEPPNRSAFIRDIDHLETRAKSFFHGFKQPSERRFSLTATPPDPEASEVLLTSFSALEEKLNALDGLPDELRAVANRCHAVREDLARVIAGEDENYIFWGEVRGSGVFLNASSIDVAPLMQDALYSRSKVVFTSATLSSGGNFDYLCSRLGIDDAETIALPSPFDFKSQAIIYLPPMPDPNLPTFLSALAGSARELIDMVGGRTLFLFTSFRNMHEVRRLFGDDTAYPILMQGDAPRHTLLERFKENVDSVLFATSSFWQGVDVPGESLSCVIVDRLPFASPGDPIMAARIEHIRKKGGNPFMDYQLPHAVLTLKQGLGRLIRHRNDRGIMMVADPRLKSKGYGKTFLASFPPAPIVVSIKGLAW